MNWETFRLVATAACITGSVAILVYLLIRRLGRRPPAASGLSGGQAPLGIRRLHADVAELRQRVEAVRTDLTHDLPERLDALQEAVRRADERIAELRRLSAPAEPAGGQRGGREGDEILRLSRQGLEPVEIARRMKMPVGEVNLVLRLEQSAGQR
jgi:hypothetical protein